MKFNDPWESSLPYEPFMGRWSRKIAALFLDWLNPARDLRWLDVGCGTGALSSLIAQTARPQEVLGIDPSAAFVAFSSHAAQDVPYLNFKVAGVDNIPAPDHYFDIVVSGLAFNFFPDPAAGLREMRRVVKPQKEIALYAWDYAEGMQMLRYFWDAAGALDPQALALDEKVRFPICRPDSLAKTFAEAGFELIEICALETATVFADFDDYWQPFLGGVGPAPGYVKSLNPSQQAALASALRAALPIRPDGSIPLMARAWAMKGST